MSTQLQQAQPLVSPSGSGQFVELGDHRGYIRLSALHTGGAFMLFDLQVDPNGGVPPHMHLREDETFFVQEGSFEFVVGEQRVESGAGDCVFAPRNLAHSFRCVSEGGGKVLVLITPGTNFEAFGIAMAQLASAPSAAMADPTVAAEFMALTQSYGIIMLPQQNL